MSEQREPSAAAKKMITLAQIGQAATSLPPGQAESEDIVRGLRGWAQQVREEHFLTAAETMERAADRLDAVAAGLDLILNAYQSEVADSSEGAMLTWSADLEEAVSRTLDALGIRPDPEAAP